LTLGAGLGAAAHHRRSHAGDRALAQAMHFSSSRAFIENLGRREVRSRGDERRKETPASSSLPSPLLLLRLRIGIDDVAGLILVRPQDHLLDRAQYCPFPVLAVSDFADHGLEAVANGCSRASLSWSRLFVCMTPRKSVAESKMGGLLGLAVTLRRSPSCRGGGVWQHLSMQIL
jgi:hypothetical protein